MREGVHTAAGVSKKQVRIGLCYRPARGCILGGQAPGRMVQNRSTAHLRLEPEGWLQVFSLQIVFKSGSIPGRVAF